ncbi:PTH1 family peptidyl-tRNA hydrolase [Streptomonospora nanhaiensis]|uniref:Peptidyl-tRNA hydrolase n=1 Tax=Streptomonospora nanhaiensis TaxID=1323731 RepID=A0A853BN43_9ACTN|nr:aminoacyl-tRNA hydrolase [Streptomonospora nanhaiensis]NYI96154.1 PTH1 family peptidyl-tRNA hydrolase [Streptomonospora nanhaiensis]
MRGLLRWARAGRASASPGAAAAAPAGEASGEEAAVEAERWLVVGLGNPGPTYAGNRHNVGFMVADLLAERGGARFKAHKARAETAETRVAGVPAVLAKPRSYMNLSGGPVAALSRFYKIPLERILVVHDELDIPFAALRLKRGGGAGGHNGLRSLTSSLGAPDYLRVRVGVGRPPGRMDAAAYVLKDFSGTERKDLGVVLERAADAVETVLTEGLEKAQNTFHASA